MNVQGCNDRCRQRLRQGNRILPCLPDTIALSSVLCARSCAPYERWRQATNARHHSIVEQLEPWPHLFSFGTGFYVVYWPFAGPQHCHNQERQRPALLSIRTGSMT